MSEFNPIDEITEMEDLRSLAKEQQAEIARLKIARIPHKDDDALGLALLNQFIELQQYRSPDARKHLVETITTTTAPLRDEIARLQASHDELVKIAALVGEQDDPFAAWESLEGIVEAALEQKP